MHSIISNLTQIYLTVLEIKHAERWAERYDFPIMSAISFFLFFCKRHRITKRSIRNYRSLTHSLTELSPSCELSNCAATQELPSILWNPKVHYRPHNWSQSWARSIQPIPSYISKIHINIVHPPKSWYSEWSLSFWLSHQYPACIPFLSYSCYMPIIRK
jgi:hypothetical protein